ncbi:hypothetical protein [uncultured Psychroserpens sp.]|uniref:hypothetical protein n=1 Tax=uncultured Psychroserpens sp. TaxID=255436 RepID=UPI0026344AD0|nr:hypothetical protein [uncultured Psychroserpens sp.]
MKPMYETVIFKSYENGFYTFTFDNGVDMDFEEIHPQILMRFDLKNDKTLLNKVFHIAYSEDIVDDEDDFIIYRIEYLELINVN